MLLSENPFEAWIKPYRYAKNQQSRQTSMQDNNTDCLINTMYLPSRQNIRKFEEVPTVKNIKKDYFSEKIGSFFILHEDGMKW